MPLSALTRRLAHRLELPRRALDVLGDGFALGARLYLARVFFLSGLTKLRDWDITVALFTDEYHVPLLSPEIAAVAGTAAEVALPVLLVVGLGSRFAAAGLFVLNAVAAISYPDLSPLGLADHHLWGVLLAMLVLQGPGRASLDAWLFPRVSSRTVS
jgi:putative oxidoreductase